MDKPSDGGKRGRVPFSGMQPASSCVAMSADAKSFGRGRDGAADCAFLDGFNQCCLGNDPISSQNSQAAGRLSVNAPGGLQPPQQKQQASGSSAPAPAGPSMPQLARLKVRSSTWEAEKHPEELAAPNGEACNGANGHSVSWAPVSDADARPQSSRTRPDARKLVSEVHPLA